VRNSNYDKFPSVAVPDAHASAVEGWPAIAEAIRRASGGSGVVVIDCYSGVDARQVARELSARLEAACVVISDELMLSPPTVDQLVEPFVGGSDPVFGWLSGLELAAFFDPSKLATARDRIAAAGGQLVLVIGTGASIVHDRPSILVYADLPRWEGQLRMRRGEVANLGAANQGHKWSLQYKRAFFIDWRVCDRHKRTLLGGVDLFLDTTSPDHPKLADGNAIRRGLLHCTTRPFRIVPFFDPAPWGGQWMKGVCGLDSAPANYGWCFDCVPEENSLVLNLDGVCLELPSIDLVFAQPERLLGSRVYARFGAEFPIRFDFLDTMGGGNLSFQVHPTTDYIQQHFGMHYTQDESYYLLDAGEGASVYLGLKSGIDSGEMMQALEEAQRDPAKPFDADRYSNAWPARKHDHFLIPAGTVHCSGAEAMVLEISATPYIFTFKLWDWGRLGLDGRPRPIHLDHGRHVIDWRRDTAWTQTNLINHVESVAAGDGWREERSGLHETQFIETRRHWFTSTVPHHTGGGVNVLNLVEGEEITVESPSHAFEPFIVHYAETFIVPAAVDAYTIRPSGSSAGRECATLKAFVRT
jgi:mannose-6-phosphate isomerase class I